MKILSGLPKIHSLKVADEARLARSSEGKSDLVLHTMREAFIYARQCCRCGLRDDEIYSLCYAALTSAAKRYKPAKGRFFAYAKVFVRGQISRSWKRLDVVKHSSLHEISDKPEISKHVILDGTARHDDYEADLPMNPEFSVDPEFEVIEIRERMKLVRPLMKTRLTKHEQMVMELRYESGFDLQKIGTLFGVSRQAVEHHHSNAIMKLRRALMLRGQL